MKIRKILYFLIFDLVSKKNKSECVFTPVLTC